jgi:uncharacterized UPF0160 family protein
MFFLKKRKKLITHNGSFHSDDIFACATLSILLEKEEQRFEVIRTRDQKTIDSADYVFDVGGIHDPLTNRFDHHQKGGAGKRENGIEYSSFGLVWKKFGTKICGTEEVAKIIDDRLVAPVDAFDNGIDLVENKHKISPYFIQHLFFTMRPFVSEKSSVVNNKLFLESVLIAKKILLREIMHTKDTVLSEQNIISIYNETKDKRILILDENFHDHNEEILSKLNETLFVIYPKEDKMWGIRAVKESPKTFKNRKDFPRAWAGLRDEELQNITKIKEAVFCHKGLFLAVAKSKEGAIKLAELALLE